MFSSEFPPTPFKFRRYSFELQVGKLHNRLELLAESHVFEFNFNLTHISEDKKTFSHGSYPYPCPPELEARKNLSWCMNGSTSSAQQRRVICSHVNKRADVRRRTSRFGFLIVFHARKYSRDLNIVIDLVSHRPEPSRQPYTLFICPTLRVFGSLIMCVAG